MWDQLDRERYALRNALLVTGAVLACAKSLLCAHVVDFHVKGPDEIYREQESAQTERDYKEACQEAQREAGARDSENERAQEREQFAREVEAERVAGWEAYEKEMKGNG